MSDVSVVIPSLRGGEGLVRAVKSVRENDFVLEIIVIFNGENALNNESEFLSKVSESTSTRVSTFSRKDINSAPEARNFGLSFSKGRYIHFLDDDDYVSSCFYEKALESIRTCPGVVGVSFSAFVLSDIDGSIISHAIRRVNLVDKSLLCIDNFVGVTSAVVVDSKAARSVGGFDESMPARQDYSFWLRLSEKGKFICLKDKELFWVEHIKTMSLSSRLQISKHKEAIRKIDELRRRIQPVEERSLSSRLKAKSSNYKYLASISRRQGSSIFIYWAFLSFISFPNLAILSFFLPGKVSIFLKKLLYK